MSRLIAALLVSVLLRAAPAPPISAAQIVTRQPAASEFHIVMPDGLIRMQLLHVIAGAARRLSRSACQQIFREFEDGSGQLLQTALDSSHQTGVEYLTMLSFVDGQNNAPCLRGAVMAFTQPGSRVIHVCGLRFQALFVHDSSTSEILIIHELLHSLGLRENPPSSADITQRVFKWCGA